MARKKQSRPKRVVLGVARAPLKKKQGTGVRWTPEEHESFLVGLSTHGRQWPKVAKVVRTRNNVQIEGYARRYFEQLEREGKGHLIPQKLGPGGPQPKVRAEEAYQQQDEPTLSSTSTSSGTICTTGDHDDCTGGIESTTPASIFLEQTSGGGGSSAEEVCEDAPGPASPAVGTEDSDLDAIARQMYEDLMDIVQSQHQGQ